MSYFFKYDYLGLEDESKPTGMADGSTFLEVDTATLYVAYKGEWYKQEKEEPTPDDPVTPDDPDAPEEQTEE